MRAIDKFIIHVTHNLFPLNEYSEGEINRLMAQFKEEADDLNIQITDAQLKAYIERFDSLKNSPKVTEKDLRKYSLSKLIKLVTSSKGVAEPEDAIDTTPDIVYNEDGLIIYNGSKENNCLTFGAGEKWCITRGSFGNYRYDDNRKNPTFYLVKDTNLPDSDRKSFFVVVVGKDDTYKASDRSNNDVGGRGTEWDKWEPFSFVEQNFPSIRGLRNIFKYIPLSSSEKINQTYKNNPVTIREWSNFPYTVKEQYLVVRKGKTLFDDITNELFLEKYLQKYPQIATFISTNAGIIGSTTLVSYLDKFSNQDVKSIIANMRDTINLKYLSTDIPFDVKKLLVKFNKWNLSNDERLYVTKDGSTIVKLILGDDIKISLYQADDDFPNVKLNKRTSRFLLDYTELDKIPFKNLVKLVSDETIDKGVIDNVIEKAKTDPDSAMIIKNVDGIDILLDSNSFASYKIEGDKIAQIPFSSEEVQKIFAGMEDNKGFQESAINLLSEPKDIPISVDKDALLSIVNATPYSGRMKNIGGDPAVLLTSSEGDNNFFWASETPNNPDRYSYKPIEAFGRNGDWRIFNAYASATVPYFQSYFDYLRSEGKSLTEETLLNILKSGTSFNIKKEVVRLDPPIASTSRYVPKIYNDTAYLVNRTNPRESFKLSDTGKLVKANISPANAATVLGGALPATQAATAVGRRGRPAGQPNTPQAPATPAAAGDINVQEVMDETGLLTAFLRLPRSILRRLNVTNASRVAPNGDRGAARRNNQLGNRGNVGRVIAIGSSKIYIIRLASGQIIASINVQPGNSNYILTGNADGNVAISLNSPSELVSALTNRGLAEHRSYIVREYVTQHPRHLDEVRSMIQQHINETKNI